jgi:hypothetical protein
VVWSTRGWVEGGSSFKAQRILDWEIETLLRCFGFKKLSQFCFRSVLYLANALPGEVHQLAHLLQGVLVAVETVPQAKS